MENNINKLTQLQNNLGYKSGDINVIALLGLFGEIGEVLNEVKLTSDSGIMPELLRQNAVSSAETIDALKKQIRDKTLELQVKVFLDFDLEYAFDVEIADVLYYLNALAINRGKTLEYYAGLSY